MKKVADDFIITGNKTESYLKFYKPRKNQALNYKYAWKFFEQKDVKKYIEEQMQKLDDELIAKQREVLRFLTAVMRGEVRDETLYFTGDGIQNIVEIRVPTSERIKAANLLSKRFSVYENREKLINEKLAAEIEKVKAETEKIKGIGEEVEDLSEVEGEIYGSKKE